MRKTREVLRQKWCLGRSHREVARSLGTSLGTVSMTVARASAAGLDWEAVAALSDEELEGKLYEGPAGGGQGRPLPDFAAVHAEHKRPGVTLELLHLEYLQQFPGGYQYTQFCEYYRPATSVWRSCRSPPLCSSSPQGSWDSPSDATEREVPRSHSDADAEITPSIAA